MTTRSTYPTRRAHRIRSPRRFACVPFVVVHAFREHSDLLAMELDDEELLGCLDAII